MKSKRILATLSGVTMSVLVASSPSPAGASDKSEKVRDDRKPKLEKEVSTDEVTVTDSEIRLNATGTNGTFTAEAKQVAAWGASNFWLKSASTARIGGPSSGYSTHVHAAMNEYDSKSDWQSAPEVPVTQWTSGGVDNKDAASIAGPANQRPKATQYFWNASGHTFTASSSGWTFDPNIDSYYSCTSSNCVSG